ncbi:YqzL family protein [Bacillus sp. FJAT-27231]|uniref:YqzL family protein n=1 Tax=Bacillus sp. FJAT-27231 TaxID=1679168 RepID=UPI0009E4D9A2|nr:YqzL family protein [Bacillus sp. FJAT-27231]
MLDFTWKVFSETGSVEMYLLYKEIEKGGKYSPFEQEQQLASPDFPVAEMTN